MKTISIFLFVIFKVSFCCDNPSNISFMPPFQDLKSIQMKVGEDLNIVCCHPDGADNLSWQDKLNNIILFKNFDGVFSLKDDKDRLILRIDNIAVNKMGEYTCRHSKRGLSKSIRINARESPLIPEIKKLELFFPSNRPIKIRCPVGSNQALRSWIFSRSGSNVIVTKSGANDIYEVSQNMSTFTLKNFGKQTSINKIWCQFQEVANNGDVKTGLYEFTWTIYSPIDVKLVVDHKGPILESNNIRLICYFQYNEMLSVSFPNNRLTNPNMSLNNNDLAKGKVVLTINKITRDSDGEYECKVTKFLSVEPMQIVEEFARVSVDVVVTPKIINNEFVTSSAKLNDDAYLSCQITSKQLEAENVYFEHYRPDRAQWEKLSDNTGKYNITLSRNKINILNLQIKKVSWEDRGKYKCVAKNAAGKDSQIGLFQVEKKPELTTNASIMYLATKPLKVDCSVSGYPVSSAEDTVELKVLNQTSPLALNVVDRQIDRLNGITVTYEVVNQGELAPGTSYKLECYYKSMRTSFIQRTGIELRVAQRPKPPVVSIVCSGSSGIVFKYQVLSTEDRNVKMSKNILTYAPSEAFDSMVNKPSKVIPVKDDEKTGNLTYVLKDLVASRNYKFKWESFNIFGLSTEQILSYSTKNFIPTRKPTILEFSPKENNINVNVTWEDECPFTGANSAIIDIIVTMQPIIKHEGRSDNWQWVERNFTLEEDKSSAQFLIYLENPQIDYEIQVALRSHQGTSESYTGIYRANAVLTGSLFSCFPRCSGSMLSCSLLTLVVILLLSVLQWCQ